MGTLYLSSASTSLQLLHSTSLIAFSFASVTLFSCPSLCYRLTEAEQRGPESAEVTDGATSPHIFLNLPFLSGRVCDTGVSD